MSILDDKEVLKKRRCNTIIGSSVQHSSVKQLGSGARERKREREIVIEREVHCFKVDHGDCRSIIN